MAGRVRRLRKTLELSERRFVFKTRKGEGVMGGRVMRDVTAVEEAGEEELEEGGGGEVGSGEGVGRGGVGIVSRRGFEEEGGTGGDEFDDMGAVGVEGVGLEGRGAEGESWVVLGVEMGA
jgi:hypothetical protein